MLQSVKKSIKLEVMKSYSLSKFFQAFEKRKWAWQKTPPHIEPMFWTKIFRKFTKIQFIKLKLLSFRDIKHGLIKPNNKFKVMKTRIWLNILAVAVLSLLFACGSDNPTGPGTNPPVVNDSVIFLKDTLMINDLDTNAGSYTDHCSKNITDTYTRISIQATCQTNTNQFTDVNFGTMQGANFTPPDTLITFNNSAINNSFYFQIYPHYATGINYLAYISGSIWSNATPGKYIRITNIKISAFH